MSIAGIKNFTVTVFLLFLYGFWTHLFSGLEFLAVEAVEQEGEEEVEYHEVAHDQGGQEDGQAGLGVTLPIFSTCHIINEIKQHT